MGPLAPTAAHAVKAQGVQTGTRRGQSRGMHAAGTLGSRARSQQRTSRSRRRRRTAQVTQGGNEPPTTQQAGCPPTRGKSQIFYGQDQRSAISASCSVLTVCRVRSCHARAHCVARSLGLAITPKNGYVCTAGAQSRVEHHSSAPTTVL